MSRTERVLVASLFTLSGLVFACASPTAPAIAACQSDEACPANARCTASACIGNSPPTARFEVSGELQANTEISLDAAPSSDPDRDDAIVSHAWRITAIEAACSAPAISNTTQRVSVRFGCAGKYQVSLTVIDEMHSESAPFTRTLAVTARTGSALVQAGPDQTVEHACSGEPLECRPASAIHLTATLASESFQNVRWTVVPPPGREIGPGTGRAVTFLPSANVLEPTVDIATDGAAISGDWDFRVEVLDGVGVLDAAVTRVSVANRPPEISGGPAGPFDHRYEPSNHSFLATSSFPVQLVDPDGDPVAPSVRHQHTGDGTASFSAWWLPAGDGLPDRVGFDVLAHTSAELIADGVERSVVVEALDLNGGSASSTFSVLIGNRPPTFSGSVPTPSHQYDAEKLVYVSSIQLGSARDPDGDPLAFEVAADADCPTYTWSGTALALHCESAGPLGTFLRSRTAEILYRDPWWEALNPATRSFRIGNHLPVVWSPTYSPTVTCSMGAATSINCGANGYVPGNLVSAITATIPMVAYDSDGDPVEIEPLSAYGLASSCAPGTNCSLRITIPQEATCSTSPTTRTITFSAFDGAGSANGTVTVDASCR
jgi:hypothetical protein